jgi:hypothetical protein
MAGSPATARDVFEDAAACGRLAGMFHKTTAAGAEHDPRLPAETALAGTLCAFVERLVATVPTSAVRAVFVSNAFADELLSMLDEALARQDRAQREQGGATLAARLVNVLFALSLCAVQPKTAVGGGDADGASLLFRGNAGGAVRARMCHALVRILHRPDRADNSLRLRTSATTVLLNVLDAGAGDGDLVDEKVTSNRKVDRPAPLLRTVGFVRAVIRLAEQWIVHYVVEQSPKTKMDSTLLPCVLVLLHLCKKEEKNNTAAVIEEKKAKAAAPPAEEAGKSAVGGGLTTTLEIMLRMSTGDFLKRSVIYLMNPISSTARVATSVGELVWTCCGKDGQTLVQFAGAGAAAQILIQKGLLQLPGT